MLGKDAENSTKVTKRSVSFRVDQSDFDKIKAITKRMRVRESDFFRFAIQSTINKLALIGDEELKGTDVMPVFVDCGAEIATYFKLDSARIEQIINSDLEDESRRVEAEDIGLLAMAAMPERYLTSRLKNLIDKPIESTGVAEALKEYLNEKYLDDLDD